MKRKGDTLTPTHTLTKHENLTLGTVDTTRQTHTHTRQSHDEPDYSRTDFDRSDLESTQHTYTTRQNLRERGPQLTMILIHRILTGLSRGWR